jgi:hypothetical protein
VALVRSGRCEALMKGSLHTDELMAEVVRQDTGLRTARRISHCFVMDVPGHPDTLIISDAAVNIAPTLGDKVHIVQNAIDLAQALRFENVRVALLSAMETVNPQIPSTIEAAALCKMAERGQITGGLLAGPLALVVGIANESSIAYGCAHAFGQLGAELAVTYLNERAKPHVQPLAQALGAPLCLPLDVEQPGELEAVFEAVRAQWGRLDILCIRSPSRRSRTCRAGCWPARPKASSAQVTLVGLERATEPQLCDFAARQGFVLWPKHDDFRRLVAAPGTRRDSDNPPP